MQVAGDEGGRQAVVGEFNRGDLRALDRRFAPAERFEWYSTDAPGQL